MVNLWRDGVRIASKTANEHRKFLVDLNMHKHGNCGFRFPLVYPLNPKSRFTIKVNGKRIKLTDDALAQKKALPLKPISHLTGDPLMTGHDKNFFIHIPKTAGTSMRMMLYDVFDQESILPNLTDIQGNGGGYPPFEKLLGLVNYHQKQNVKLVMGHYPFIPNALFSSPPKTFTFLREPIARTISNLFHLKKYKAEYYQHSLEEVFEANPRQMQNMQVRYLAGAIHKKNLDQNDFKQARYNLKHCRFVGITERFEESISILEHLFDWSFPERVRANVNYTDNKKELPKTLMKKIKDANKMDVALYKQALILFERKNNEFMNSTLIEEI